MIVTDISTVSTGHNNQVQNTSAELTISFLLLDMSAWEVQHKWKVNMKMLI